MIRHPLLYRVKGESTLKPHNLESVPAGIWGHQQFRESHRLALYAQEDVPTTPARLLICLSCERRSSCYYVAQDVEPDHICS